MTTKGTNDRHARPWAINIRAQGLINGTELTANGTGVIRKPGVYQAGLNFTAIPKAFHPSAIGTFVISVCCEAQASSRNGSSNLVSMGVENYTCRRIITIGDEQLLMSGEALYKEEVLDLSVSVSGDINLPDDLCGHSAYVAYREPAGGGSTIRSVGEGSLFRASGEEIPVRVDSEYSLEPDPLPNPLRGRDYRIVTEDGELIGLTYMCKIHSISDGANTLRSVDDMAPAEFTGTFPPL